MLARTTPNTSFSCLDLSSVLSRDSHNLNACNSHSLLSEGKRSARNRTGSVDVLQIAAPASKVELRLSARKKDSFLIGQQRTSLCTHKQKNVETRILHKGRRRTQAVTQCAARASSSIDLEYLELRNVGYQPPGCETPILNDVNLSLERHSMGLMFGRSGSGKTTLLQILAGLAAPTSGSLYLHSALYGTRGPPLSVAEVAARTGLVFQFPERYFLTDSVADELLFGHLRNKLGVDMFQKVADALHSVGMDHIPMQTAPRALSDGYKRRLALAVQLVRKPEILLLDEPLAGLDWQARLDVVHLLRELKKTTTLIVVSHDLRELAPLVDKAWRMHPGGRLELERLPLESLSGRLELFQSAARV